MAGQKKKAFVAYASRDQAHAETVLEGVRRANALAQPYVYHPWPFNDIAGQPLISPILENIDESALVVADVTFLNLNVVYEIGYAIGKKKRAFLVRNGAIEGEKALARSAGIFDTLGYQEYADAQGLAGRLAAYIEERPLSFDLNLDPQTQVYVVEPPTQGTDATVMVSRVKKAGYRYRSFNPDEDSRLSATDAIRQVSVSSGIVLLLQSDGVAGSDAHNVRTMFVAGLAEGMAKPTLILSPRGYTVPLDIRDDVQVFRTEADIVAAIADFVPLIVSHFTDTNPAPLGPATLLQSIAIGDPRAENEMTTLERYYVKTDQFERAVRGEVSLVVGRKGSGKTALFIRARDKTRPDKRNIMVDLKPEGYQLVKLKEEILEYLSEGARQHLITAFWEYLILLEVTYKLLEKDRHIYKHNHEIHDLYVEFSRTYNAADFTSSPDYGKEMRATLDWSDTDMLREMLRLRLVSNFKESERNADFFMVWRQLCDTHYAGEESSAYLIDRSLMRPRNLLKIFNHCRKIFNIAAALQRIFSGRESRVTISPRDYSRTPQDLVEELDRELTDVFPAARDLLYHFLDAQAVLSPADLTGTLTAANIEPADHER
jgi:hypothetical protein